MPKWEINKRFLTDKEVTAFVTAVSLARERCQKAAAKAPPPQLESTASVGAHERLIVQVKK